MDRYIYGTLKECVDKLWERIDWENGKFPEFDYAAIVSEDCKTIKEAIKDAEAWFGCKDITKMFQGDTFSLVFGYYAGGVAESMEFEAWSTDHHDDDEENKERMMACIGNSTDRNGYGILEPNDYILFDTFEGEIENDDNI